MDVTHEGSICTFIFDRVCEFSYDAEHNKLTVIACVPSNGEKELSDEKRKGRMKKDEREKARSIILKNSRSFYGEKSDKEVMEMCGVSNATFYHMKRELKSFLGKVW